MQRLATLLAELDGADDALAVQALATWFGQPQPVHDGTVAALLLAGRRGPRLLDAATMRALAQDLAGLPPWLWDLCESEAGGAAEALAHVLPPGGGPTPGVSEVSGALLALAGQGGAALRDAIGAMLQPLVPPQRRLLLQLAAGAALTRLAPTLLHQGLARAWQVDPARMALRLGRLLARKAWPTADAAASWPLSPVPHEDALLPQPFRPWRQLPWPAAEIPPRADAGADGPWVRPWLRGLRVQCRVQAGQMQLWGVQREWHTPWLRGHKALPLDDLLVEGHWAAAPGAPALLLHDLLWIRGRDLGLQSPTERQAQLQSLALPAWMALADPPQPLGSRPLAQWRQQARQRGWRGLLVDPGRDDSGIEAWPLPALEGLAQVAYLEWPSTGHPGPSFELAAWNRTPTSAAEVEAAQAAARAGLRPRPGALALLPLGRTSALDPQMDTTALMAAVRDHAVARYGPVQALRPGLVVRIRFDVLLPNRRRRAGCELAGAVIMGLVGTTDPAVSPTLDGLLRVSG